MSRVIARPRSSATPLSIPTRSLPRPRSLAAALAALAVGTSVALAGCSAPAANDPGTLTIVASTNVYGDLAEQVAGDAATVTSLITGPAQDPHSFEPSARDELAVRGADLVIVNGGGYDPFMARMLSASGSTAEVLDVAAFANLPAGGNEHLWYDLGTMSGFTLELGSRLAALDPANADAFTANATALAGRIDDIRESIDGTQTGPVAVTEPVPLSLLETVGLVNETPETFTEAIEEGADVPPAALAETLAVVASVRLLAYNSQTASAETERVRAAAEQAGVPVVEFTELLPDGQDYVSWMTGNARAIAEALTP